MASITYAGPARLLNEGYEEWLLDEAIDDTFPASDPVAPGQPGSSVNLRYAALERRGRQPRPGAFPALAMGLLLGFLAALALLHVVRRKERDRTLAS